MVIDEHNWYFEEEKGIDVIHEIYDKIGYVKTDRILIPWKRLLESVTRKYEDYNPSKRNR